MCPSKKEKEESKIMTPTTAATTPPTSSSSSNDTTNVEKDLSNDKQNKQNDDNNNNDGEEDVNFEFHYYIFGLFLMIGFVIHSRRDAESDFFVSAALAILYILGQNYNALHQFIFLVFLTYCVYSTIEHSPNNANHHNVCGFVTFLLIPQQVRRCYALFQRKLFPQEDKMTNNKKDDADTDNQNDKAADVDHSNNKNNKNKNNNNNNNKTIYYHCDTVDALDSVRITVILMYVMAGFHKLNTDFLNIQVSCAYDKIWTYFEIMDWANDEVMLFDQAPQVLQTLPYQVIVMEMIPPFLLGIPQFQRYGLALLITLHTLLLPFGFPDFGSIAQAFLWLFVHPQIVAKCTLPKHCYTDMGLLMILFELGSVFVHYRTDPEGWVPFVEAEFAFVLVTFAVIWLSIFRIPNEPCQKVQFPKSKWRVAALWFFVWFGMNPYLGLRTIGCLTMFSNLTTEGPRSNHLLLGSNPLKLFDYQEDVVYFIEVDERFPNRQAGDIVPRITFDNYLFRMKQLYDHDNDDDYHKPYYLWIEYNNTTYESDNVFHDPIFEEFLIPRPYWQRKYMIFRNIQKEGPQQCTW